MEVPGDDGVLPRLVMMVTIVEAQRDKINECHTIAFSRCTV